MSDGGGGGLSGRRERCLWDDSWNGMGVGNSGFPSGMTERTASATATATASARATATASAMATADSLQE